MVYAAPIEAGFAATYPGDPLGEFLRGDMSSRRFFNLLNGLPQDGWYWHLVRKDAEEAEKAQRDDTILEGRKRLMRGAYRNTPDHQKPDYLREAVPVGDTHRRRG